MLTWSVSKLQTFITRSTIRNICMEMEMRMQSDFVWFQVGVPSYSYQGHENVTLYQNRSFCLIQFGELTISHLK